MKHSKRPTKRQCMEIEANGLDPSSWYIERDTPIELVVVHRYAGSNVRRIPRDRVKGVAR